MKYKQWAELNDERVKKHRAWFYEFGVDYLFLILGNKCDWCDSKSNLQIDHIKPLSRTRGERSNGNLYYSINLENPKDTIRLLCEFCHRNRHSNYANIGIWKHLPEMFYFE